MATAGNRAGGLGAIGHGGQALVPASTASG